MSARRRWPIARPSRKAIENDYTHKKQTGGSGQYARVKLRFEPLPPGGGFEFENEVVGGIGAEGIHSRASRRASTASRNTGVIAGFPVIDFKVYADRRRLPRRRTRRRSPSKSRRARPSAKAWPKAGPKLLEPIMKVEVVTPEDYMGDVIGDLNSRRGQITGMDSRGNARVIHAMVPLANMFGYVNTLRSMSQGRANYTMHFDHYEQVPQAVADEVRAKMA